jgi:peptide/nickel transport system substrate-binding protein
LESGQLTWGGNFVSHIQQVFANTSDHQYFFPAVNTVALFPNLDKWPTNNLAVRQAISLAVNRTQVAQEGEEGDENAASTATGLIVPNDNQYLTNASKNTLPNSVAQAKAVLTKAGFTMKGGVWTSATGQPVSFSLEDPASYSDYMSSIQAIAQELNQIGMKVTVDGISANAWNSDIQSGNFQMTLRWGQTAPDPYGQYENWLDPSLIGGGTGNFERYTGADATKLLTEYAGSSNQATDKAAITGLGNIVATKLPVIPIMYGASWGEYNSSTIKGWPTKADPYDPAQPSVPWDEYTVLQLHT